MLFIILIQQQSQWEGKNTLQKREMISHFIVTVCKDILTANV